MTQTHSLAGPPATFADHFPRRSSTFSPVAGPGKTTPTGTKPPEFCKAAICLESQLPLREVATTRREQLKGPLTGEGAISSPSICVSTRPSQVWNVSTAALFKPMVLFCNSLCVSVFSRYFPTMFGRACNVEESCSGITEGMSAPEAEASPAARRAPWAMGYCAHAITKCGLNLECRPGISIQYSYHFMLLHVKYQICQYFCRLWAVPARILNSWLCCVGQWKRQTKTSIAPQRETPWKQPAR